MLENKKYGIWKLEARNMDQGKKEEEKFHYHVMVTSSTMWRFGKSRRTTKTYWLRDKPKDHNMVRITTTC